MATYFVDTEGGSDANSGLTFALRKKTITSASSAGASGDTIRIMQSPDPTAYTPYGDALWTKDNSYIMFPAPMLGVKNVDMCESGWTSVDSINNTLTYSTTAKEGTNAINFAVGAGSTNPRIYKTLSSTDFSGYQQLSFWVRQSAGTIAASGTFQIVLCSDTSGNTATNTFTVPYIPVLNSWHAFTINFGSALGTGIQSIRIEAPTGARTFQFDNIIACRAPGASDFISLRSLISKNTGTEPWIPIRSINATTGAVRADCGVATLTADAVALYAGDTETVQAYTRETVRPALPTTAASTAYFTVNKNLTISGGWNTTDMSTQTGDTYCDWTSGNGTSTSSTFSLALSNFKFVRAAQVLTSSTSTTSNISADIIGCSVSFNTVYNIALGTTVTLGNVSYNGGNNTTAIVALGATTLGTSGTNINILSGWGNSTTVFNSTGAGTVGLIGAYIYRANISISDIQNTTMTSGSALQFGGGLIDSTISIQNIIGSATNSIAIGATGASIGSLLNNIFNISGTISSKSNTSGTAALVIGTCVNNTVNLGTTTISNSGGGKAVIVTQSSFNNVINGGTTSATTTYDGAIVRFNGTTFSSSPTSSDSSAYSSRITTQSYNATVGDNRIYSPLGVIQSDTTIRHTGSGYSWKISPTSNNASASYPLELPIAQAAVASGTLVTASIWVYRTNIGITSNWLVRGGTGEILPATITASAGGSAGAWEQLTVTFTPSTSGVVQFFAQAYGGTTYSAYFDDMSISQAD